MVSLYLYKSHRGAKLRSTGVQNEFGEGYCVSLASARARWSLWDSKRKQWEASMVY